MLSRLLLCPGRRIVTACTTSLQASPPGPVVKNPPACVPHMPETMCGYFLAAFRASFSIAPRLKKFRCSATPRCNAFRQRFPPIQPLPFAAFTITSASASAISPYMSCNISVTAFPFRRVLRGSVFPSFFVCLRPTGSSRSVSAVYNPRTYRSS